MKRSKNFPKASSKYICVKRYEEEEDEEDEEEEGGDDQKKIKNMDFFKTKSLLPLMIINEKTQLGGLVSLSKRF